MPRIHEGKFRIIFKRLSSRLTINEPRHVDRIEFFALVSSRAHNFIRINRTNACLVKKRTLTQIMKNSVDFTERSEIEKIVNV